MGDISIKNNPSCTVEETPGYGGLHPMLLYVSLFSSSHVTLFHKDIRFVHVFCSACAERNLGLYLYRTKPMAELHLFCVRL